MAYLAGKAAGAKHYHPVGEHATAHAAAEGYQHEIVHAVGSTVGMLAKGPRMGVVAYGNSQSQTVAEHGCYRHHALPWQIGRILYAACHVV